MSVSTAALVAAWIAIILLFLAYAGLRRQLLLIERAPRTENLPTSKVRRRVELDAHGGAAIVMLAADDCPVCHEVAPLFTELAQQDQSSTAHLVLTRSGVLDEAVDPVKTVVDPQAFNTVYPGYLPALILLDDQGYTMAVEPVGARQAMSTAHQAFATKLQAKAAESNTGAALT